MEQGVQAGERQTAVPAAVNDGLGGVTTERVWHVLKPGLCASVADAGGSGTTVVQVDGVEIARAAQVVPGSEPPWTGIVTGAGLSPGTAPAPARRW